MLFRSVFCAPSTTSRTDKALHSQFNDIKAILKKRVLRTRLKSYSVDEGYRNTDVMEDGVEVINLAIVARNTTRIAIACDTCEGEAFMTLALQTS